MSSATSTDDLRQVKAAETSPDDSASFQPWQFFLLAGMLAATATVIVATGQSPASIVVLSLTVIAASLVGLAVYRSLLPLVLPHTVHAPTLIAGRTRAALEREKALVLRSIKELEFDRAMGKVGQGDFDEMSARLRARALGLMRQLDSGGGYRDEIERELRTRLARDAGQAEIAGQAEVAGLKSRATVEPFVSPTRETVPAVARDFSPAVTPDAAVCASCNTTNDADAKFCKNCGTKLVA